jgi:hypothetical protein
MSRNETRQDREAESKTVMNTFHHLSRHINRRFLSTAVAHLGMCHVINHLGLRIMV